MKQRFYLIIQNRWGDEDGHSYECGVAKDKLTAEIMGNYFAMSRGGKYDFKIEERTVDYKDENKLKILHVFNGDKEDSLFVLCGDTDNGVANLNKIMDLYHRDLFELKKCMIWTRNSLSKNVIEDNLHLLSTLSPEAQQLVKDLYEKQLRDEIKTIQDAIKNDNN